MLNQLEAATFLKVLSRRATLTELDAARALNNAARLLASDPWSTTTRVRMPRQAGHRGVASVAGRAQPPAV
ncbi:MAG: hypothetical protein QOF53_2132 [Nocardioidaceae bacterium]|jgi:hypothetical protein|nr:hypothetical protein [Nocardioidaceae bacterium]